MGTYLCWAPWRFGRLRAAPLCGVVHDPGTAAPHLVGSGPAPVGLLSIWNVERGCQVSAHHGGRRRWKLAKRCAPVDGLGNTPSRGTARLLLGLRWASARSAAHTDPRAGRRASSACPSPGSGSTASCIGKLRGGLSLDCRQADNGASNLIPESAHATSASRKRQPLREESPVTTTFPRLLLEHAARRPGRAGDRARRTSASGRPGPGRRCATRCARSPAASPRRGFAAASTSRSSATTGRACTGRCSRRSAWAAMPVPLYQDARGSRDRLRAQRRRDRATRSSRTRSRSTSCSRSAAAVPAAAPHLLRRPARPAPLQRARPRVARLAARARPRRRPRASAALRRRGGRRPAARRGGDALHLGHHRQAEGRVQTHDTLHRPRRRPAPRFDRLSPDDERALLPADGVGRRPHLLATRSGWSAASRQLPGVGATR